MREGFTHVVDRVAHDLTSRQHVPDPGLIGLCGLLALVLVLAPTTWLRVRLAITAVHEAGHALVAVLVGRRLHGIRLHADTSGLTRSRGRPRGIGMVAMLAAGYTAPAALGWAAALLVADGRLRAWLWLIVAITVAMAPWLRNVYGVAVLAVLGGGAAAIAWWGSRTTVEVAAVLSAWVLLLAAPRPLLELLAAGRRRPRTSDPDQLAQLTHLPAVVWILLLAAANGAGLVLGAARLVAH